MSTLRIVRFWLLCGALLLGQCAVAEVAVPTLLARVTDLTATLSGEQREQLEQKLAAFEAQKGSQIGVLIVPTTAPESIEQYSLRVVERWKLGRKKVDDGVLLIIAKDDHTMRLEVGYGLEGVLNDATSKRIIAEIMTPRFRAGDFYGGIDAALDSMIKLINGEALPAPTGPQKAGAGVADGIEGLAGYMPLFLILVLVGGAILRRLFGNVPGALATAAATGGLAWLLAGAISLALLAAIAAFFFTLVGSRSHGWGRGLPGVGGFGGGGFGGGGGGGGFGGGGGGFGGGGASGKW